MSHPAPRLRGRMDAETCRYQVDRSHRLVYPSSLQRCLLSRLDSAADRIEGLALFLYRHGDQRLVGLAVGTAVDRSVCVIQCITFMERRALSAKSVAPESILFGRRVPVDSHGAGGGRNCTDPVTRHRNAGCCSERVAHFLRGLHDPLWMCRRHYVLARISSKCRCAKCQREHDTRPSNR
jgi:hypothetical protein